MNITLYKNQSDPNTIGKNITDASAHTGALREACSVISPVVTIKSDANLSTYNYAYIPEFGRYYFIGDIVSDNTGLWRLSLRVDVLESFKSGIIAKTAVIARQENKWNLYLNDPAWKVYANKQVLTRTFPSGFSDSGQYYLTVVGGYDAPTA